MWRKILREMENIGSKTSPKSWWKLAKTSPFIELQKTSRWGKFPGQMTCRPTGRSTGQWLYLWLLGLPVDRSVDRTQVLTYRSTSRSTEARTREHCSLAGRPLGRPGPDPEVVSGSVNCQVDRLSSQRLCTYLCTSVDRSVDQLSVRSIARSTNF